MWAKIYLVLQNYPQKFEWRDYLYVITVNHIFLLPRINMNSVFDQLISSLLKFNPSRTVKRARLKSETEVSKSDAVLYRVVSSSKSLHLRFFM